MSEAGDARPGCRWCGAPCPVERRGAFDDRYGYPGHFDVICCQGCGHRWLMADFTPQALQALYTEHYPRRWARPADWRPAHQRGGLRGWLAGERCFAYAWVPPGVRVLDIGCGMGETLAYHRARGCDAHGVEADEHAQRAAAAQGLAVRPGLFRAEDWPAGSFDWVTLDQVVEHVPEPVGLLRGVATVLRPGGTAVVCTPNGAGWGAAVFGRRWINWHVPYHLHLFTAASLRAAAGQAGLAVESVETITASDWLYLQWAHLLTCPSLGEPSPLWAPQRPPRLLEAAAIRLAWLFHMTHLDHLATRALDALGRGDNLVVTLRAR